MLNKRKKMKLSDTKLLMSGQIVSGILSIISVVLTARYTGPEIFGYCSVLVLILIVMMSFTDFGACSWASRELAAQTISVATYKSIMKSKSQLNLVWILFAPALFYLTPDKHKWAFVLLLYPLFLSRLNFIQLFLITFGQIKISVFLTVSERACWLTVIPLIYFQIDNSLVYALPLVLGLFVHNIVGSKFLESANSISGESVVFSQKEIAKKSRHFGVTGISGFLSNLDGFLVASLSSLSDSATYVLSQRFKSPLAVIFNSIAIRIKPLAAKKNLQLLKELYESDAKIIYLACVGMIFFSICISTFSTEIFGSSYTDLTWVIFFGTLSSIPFGVSLIFTNLLSGLGSEKFVARLHVFCLLVLLVGVGTCAHLFGSMAAVLVSFAVSVIQAVASGWKVAKDIRQIK